LGGNGRVRTGEERDEERDEEESDDDEEEGCEEVRKKSHNVSEYSQYSECCGAKLKARHQDTLAYVSRRQHTSA
jgi:hypothetical protein